MAAERITSTSTSTSRPSRVGVSKPASGGRHRSRNDRGMEVDQVGSSSTSRDSRDSTSGRRNNRNNNNRQGNSNYKNRGGNRKPPRQNDKPKKTSLNQSDLDKELDAYMMTNESTARTTLDMELDAYMSSAPLQKIN